MSESAVKRSVPSTRRAISIRIVFAIETQYYILSLLILRQMAYYASNLSNWRALFTASALFRKLPMSAAKNGIMDADKWCYNDKVMSGVRDC